jgi:hypothetical protein
MEVFIMKWNKLALFAAGVLFGTAGVSVLKSKDAKKAYTQCTAAVLRGKDAVMKTGTALKENCEDIYEDATDINEKRYAEEEARKLAEAKATVAAYEEAAAEEAKED